MTTSRTRTTLLVIGSAAAGVVTAGGLALAAARVAADDSAGSPPSTAQPPAPVAGGSPAGDAATSVPTTTTSSPPEGSDSETRVTVDVPRSEQTPPDGLVPTAPSPSTSWGSSPTSDDQPINDPIVVASAYLVAAESVTAHDTALRHHRADPYMAPGNPASTTGVLVTELPPDGHSRTVEVVAVTTHSRNDDLGRIAYWVGYQPYLSPTIPATSLSPDGEVRRTFIVVERQATGEWLVLSQTAHLDLTD